MILSTDSFHLVAVNSDHFTSLDSCLIREISQLVRTSKNTLCTPVNAFVDIDTYLAYVKTKWTDNGAIGEDGPEQKDIRKG